MARAATAALHGRALPVATAETRVPHMASGWEAPLLLVLALLALSIGLVTVYSASSVKAQTQGLPDYTYVVQQAIGGVLGLVLLAFMARLDYRLLRLLSWPLLLATVGALIVIILPFTESIAPVRNGARRWLQLGPVTLQPSEFAKLVLIAWTAALAVKKQDQLRSLSRGLAPFLLVWGLVGGLIFLQPSMSAAAIVLMLSGLVLFAAGARVGHVVLLALLAAPFVWRMVAAEGYRLSRVLTFFDPTTATTGAGYQINQALIAAGSGGVLGRGFGYGQQKFGFLPEPHNDFLFAMVGEEWGFVGMMLLITMFSAIALVGYRIARAAPDGFGFLLAIGCTNLVALQAFLHMSVNLAMIPTTGVTLPFLSYGRSSLLVSMAAVGILVNIARQAERRTE